MSEITKRFSVVEIIGVIVFVGGVVGSVYTLGVYMQTQKSMVAQMVQNSADSKAATAAEMEDLKRDITSRSQAADSARDEMTHSLNDLSGKAAQNTAVQAFMIEELKELRMGSHR